MKTKLPVVISHRPDHTAHAVYAAADTGPADGSLFGFYTLCGLLVNLLWNETATHLVSCGTCQRVLRTALMRENVLPEEGVDNDAQL